jgi:hypothetical protein
MPAHVSGHDFCASTAQFVLSRSYRVSTLLCHIRTIRGMWRRRFIVRVHFSNAGPNLVAESGSINHFGLAVDCGRRQLWVHADGEWVQFHLFVCHLVEWQ